MRPKFIINEKQYVEKCIINNKKYIIDKDFSKDLYMVIKYYSKELDYDKEKILSQIVSFIESKKENELNEKEIIIDEWLAFINANIDNFIKNKNKLRDFDKIWITDTDIEYMDTLDTKENKKTLMTLMVLAKNYNSENPNEAKITCTFNEIFKLANLSSLKRNVRQDIIADLKARGLIDLSIIKDRKTRERKIVYQVKCIEEGNNVYFVSDTSDTCEVKSIGKKYTEMKRMINNEKYKQCERCACLIEKNVKDNNNYCLDCRKILERESTRLRVEKYRKSLNM